MFSFVFFFFPYKPPNTVSCTNLQCIVTEDICAFQAEVNALSHFNAKWYNNQLDMELPRPFKIAHNASKSFTAPICKLVNKYADVFTKPSKYIAYDIK